MNRQDIRRIVSVLALVLTSAPATASRGVDAAEPDLLKRAQKVAAFAGREVDWAALLPSRGKVLYRQMTALGDAALVMRDLHSGADSPLPALQKIDEFTLSYGYDLSPDGNQLLWNDDSEQTQWSTLDGQRHGKMPGTPDCKLLWMADSKRWVAFIPPNDLLHTSIQINDIRSPGRPQFVKLLPQSPLANQDAGYLPFAQFETAIFLPSGRLLIGTASVGDNSGVDIRDLDMEQQGVLKRAFKVPLPDDVKLADFAFSPNGRHIGWLVRRGKMLLCVSAVGESQMHIIGALAITPRDPLDPGSQLSSEPGALRWSPDGKSLTFLYRNTMYRVAAGDSAAMASLPVVAPMTRAAALARARGEALEAAIFKANPEAIAQQIAAGAPTNYQDSEGLAPLMIASMRGQTETARKLLAAGADANLRDHDGYTALIDAIEGSHEETALLLLAHGARVDVKGPNGHTALLDETEKGSELQVAVFASAPKAPAGKPSLVLVRALLDHGANVNRADSEGSTPIIEAAGAASLPIIQLLVSRGAKVNAQNSMGDSALSAAIAGGRIDVSTFLLNHGANPKAKEAGVLSAGGTPLILAAFQGSIDLCKLLLARGANVNAANNAGYAPLSMAVERDNLELAGFLLDRGADPNIRMLDTYMLISAVFRNNKEMVRLLLKHGANIDAVGQGYGTPAKVKKTALGWAEAQHLDDMIPVLTAAGAKE